MGYRKFWKRILKCSEKSRLDFLREAELKPCCTDGELGIQCKGSWLECPLKTLGHNSIDRKEFPNLVLQNLEYGWGNGKNTIICGPTNCPKQFILLPLAKIYMCFIVPSQGTLQLSECTRQRNYLLEWHPLWR